MNSPSPNSPIVIHPVRSFAKKDTLTVRILAEPPKAAVFSLKPGSLAPETIDGLPVITLVLPEKADADALRVMGGKLAQWLVEHQAAQVNVDLTQVASLQIEGAEQAFVEGIGLGGYRFSAYREQKKKPGKVTVNVLGQPTLVREAAVLAECVLLARDLAHEPASVINPATLAERVRSLAEAEGLVCKVLEHEELVKMGAGSITAVGKGSRTPARIIIVEYAGQGAKKNAKPVAIVGKSLTFDSGGYSIKDSNGMVGMKYDKCGGAAVLGAVIAASRLKLRRPVVAVLGAAENMLSADSYRPDDILTSLSGKTIEVVSTDAEGRLVLADTLTYTENTYKPAAIIDLATLTGGVVVALGHHRSAILGSDQDLITHLRDSGERTAEKLWQLPLDDVYFDALKQSDADMKNSAGREASTITGAIFLRQFVSGKIPWAHIDIAGTAAVPKDTPYCATGATGFGVRLLVDYLRQLS